MPQYRKKPIIVEAVQWQPGLQLEGIENHEAHPPHHTAYGTFTTIHGQHTEVTAGTWLIREADGVHWYPCTDEVFQRTYEPVTAVRPFVGQAESWRMEG